MLRKIYQSMESGKARAFYIKADSIAQKYGGKLYSRTIKRLKQRIRNAAVRQNGSIREDTFESLCWHYEKKSVKNTAPLVSVIVPVNGSGKQLKRCLESILRQTYRNFEVLILEQDLTEESRKTITEYVHCASEKIVEIALYGKPLSLLELWNKCQELAKGIFLWIAYPDAFCESNFLQEAVGMFSYDSVKMVFSKCQLASGEGCKNKQTQEAAFEGKVVFEWDKSFHMTAHNFVRYQYAFHDTVPSISMVVYKNTGLIPVEIMEAYKDMRFYDRWFLNLYLIRGGTVGYTSASNCYISVADDDLPATAGDWAAYYEEAERLGCYIASCYKIDDHICNLMLQELINQQQTTGNSLETVQLHYHPERIRQEKEKRLPNVLIACYALKSGGGEIYPIHLANELYRNGIAVTLVNFNIEEEEKYVRQLICNGIAVITLKSKDYIKHLITQLGGDIIHSHHASVDEILAPWITCNRDLCRHVITLHGMYESLPEEDCSRVIKQTWESSSVYIYIADKNLDCFRNHGYETGSKFVKIPNGLPVVKVTPVCRATLGLSKEAFVLVIASRGIPEKGWREAILAVNKANETSPRPVHLVILGDGDIRSELEKSATAYIHFVGVHSNVRDYFSMADAGLVPTYFKGESYPLVIIECLMTGTPVIATDIAEVRNQLKDENGNLAGILLPLRDEKVNESDVCAAILELMNDKDKYRRLRERTVSACRKFDMSGIAARHMQLYQEILKTDCQETGKRQ